MKFLSKLYIQRESLLQFSSMAQSNKWWIVCVVAISCVAGFGSCRSGRQADGEQPGAFIFNELCALKDEPGPCKAIKDRFFFNIDRGQCELFEYGGCGGNANNFETLEECEETCVVSEDKNPCHLGEAPGPCRGLVTRYFFDSTRQQCRPFFYGGCFGNANNFRSMADCQAKCQNPVKTTRAPQVYTQAARNPVSAQPTITTGQLTIREPQVQLNDTHQETQELNPINVCFSPILKGTCDGAERRYAYNTRSKRCQSFHYTGCGGNENNFKYRKNCIKKCIREARGMIRVRRKNLDSIAQRSV